MYICIHTKKRRFGRRRMLDLGLMEPGGSNEPGKGGVKLDTCRGVVGCTRPGEMFAHIRDQYQYIHNTAFVFGFN